MALVVEKSRERMVKPCEKTPTGRLELSAVDKVPVLMFNARTLHVYRSHGEDAFGAIGEALSRALVPYYPLAGRLRCHGGDIFLECTADGVFLVEASANCCLRSLNYLESHANAIDCNLLLPQLHSDITDAPFVQMQVTQFACGGFVLGMVFSHTVCDGLGAAQFLKAVAEYARGSRQLSVQPVWCRDFLLAPPSPLTNAQPPPMPHPQYELEKANVEISGEQINKLKRHFQEETGQRCSSFEIVAAGLWKCRTRAIGGEAMAKLVFFANCRKLVEPPLGEGFYGNCIFPTSVTASKEWMSGASLSEVVKLIQKAKAELPREFAEYCRRSRESVAARDEPFMPALTYDLLFVSEWGRLGFNELELVAGSGRAVEIVAVQEQSVIPGVIVGWQPESGVRLISWCVRRQHLTVFLRLLSHLFSAAS